MYKSSILIFVLILFGSCTSTNTISKLQHQYQDMEIYMVQLPDRQFQEISFIEVTGGRPIGINSLMNGLVEKARNEGADGLVNVRLDSKGNMVNVSGIAIKFDQEGLTLDERP
jgi:hypothetical protein